MQIKDEKGNIISWDYNEFPDKQVQIKIHKDFIKYDIFNDNFETHLNVKVSLANPVILDLFKQLCYSFSVNHVTVNYLYGARCDKYESGDYWVGEVASEILEYLQRTVSYQVIAPHCFELMAKHKYNFTLPDCIDLDNYDLIVYPDESAQKRFSYLDKKYIVCEKHRDQETGKILSHNIPNIDESTKKVLLLDDLCDGGATFIAVNDVLPEYTKSDLFIFHGVFSNNALSRLLQKFDNIIVTNSLPYPAEQKLLLSDFDEDRVKIVNLW